MKNNILIAMMLVLMISTIAIAQNQTISGAVVDGDEILIGATVVEKGTTNGTVTDVDGKYTLEISSSDVTLVFSLVGYVTKEVVVGNQTVIDVNLVVDIQTLDEIVVTGYSSQSRKSITGSVAVVDIEKMENLPDQSVLGAMQGRITGVQIGKNGGPGGSNMVRIRGFSNTTNSNPLYIIDGVQTNNGDVFNLINPSDIESIQVLKDASSAAIYGTRANNGVIIVTTKKGKDLDMGGGVVFNLNVSHGTQSPRKEAFPEFLSPQQYADYLWTRQESPSSDLYGSGEFPVMPFYLTKDGGADEVNEADYALIAGGGNNPIKVANIEGTDWVGTILSPSTITNVNLSASKNDKNGSFYISSSYSSNKGILKHTSFDRYSLRANTEFKVKDFLTIGENLTLAYSEKKGYAGFQNESGPIMMAHRMMPIIPVYDIKGNFAGSSGGKLGNASNPLAALYRNRNNVGRDIKGLGNLYAEIEFVKGLKYRTTIGIDYTNGTSSYIEAVRLEDAEQASINKYTELSGNYSEMTFSNVLTYNANFGKHKIVPMVGLEYNSRAGRQFQTFRNGFVSEVKDFLYLSAGDATVQNNDGFGYEVNLFSYFGKFDYSFMDKIYFTGILRVDNTSRYTKENRQGYFPSVGLSWILSEENFIKNLNVFDALKIRTAWGQTGNSETPSSYPAHAFYGLDGTFNNYDINGTSNSAETGYAFKATGNRQLKWEIAQTFDVALEMAFLNNRLHAEFGFYDKKTKDMLVQVTRPATAGVSENPFVNIGIMSNMGYELSADYTQPIKDDFNVQLGFNISFNKNKVVKLDENDKTFLVGVDLRGHSVTRTQKDQPISSFFGYELDGFYTSEDEAKQFEQEGAQVGGYKYKDINGDGKINADDRTFLGSPLPTAVYGVNLGINYKNLALTFFLDGTSGNKIYNFTKFFTDYHSFPGAVSTRVLDAWTPDNLNATLPISRDKVTSQDIPNSNYIEDGAYLRVRNIKLSYSIPTSILSRFKLNRVTAFIQIDNAYVFTKYSGLDPEVNSFFDDNNSSQVNFNLGIDRGVYPNPRSIIYGINISL